MNTRHWYRKLKKVEKNSATKLRYLNFLKKNNLIKKLCTKFDQKKTCGSTLNHVPKSLLKEDQR